MTLLVLTTAYFGAAIILGSAAYLRGTTIVHDQPIAWGSLPRELFRPGWRHVFEMTPWVLVILFAAIVSAAALSRLSPDFAAPTVRRSVAVVVGLGFLPAFGGAWSLLFSLVGVSLGARVYDGEWMNEFYAVYEAFFFAFAILCWTSWPVFRQRPSS